MKKKLALILLMLSAMVPFTACSGDDDGDGLGDKNAGSENKTYVAERGYFFAKCIGQTKLFRLH